MAAKPPLPAQIYALDLGSSARGPVLCLDGWACRPFSPVDIGTRTAPHSRLFLVLFWPRGYQPRAHCIDQLMITMPFYASAALLARLFASTTPILRSGQVD